jgi:hypothetical protein
MYQPFCHCRGVPRFRSLSQKRLRAHQTFEKCGLRQGLSPCESVFGGLWNRKRSEIQRDILQALLFS